MSQETAASSTAADVLRSETGWAAPLKAKPEYNGKSGTLVAFDASPGWQVDLLAGGSLTVSNLTKLRRCRRRVRG